MESPKKKAEEIYFAMLNEGKGFISEYVASQMALVCVQKLDEQAEKVFHDYGVGFMGNSTAGNDYSKSRLAKYWEDVKKEVKLMNNLK